MSRDIPLTRLRTLGIMAHIDAGKTTCAERILYFCGKIRKTGEVHEGTAALDHLPEEQKHGITITAAATTVAWSPKQGVYEGLEHRLQLVDTPGHIDFTIEVERSLRVLDGAVFVLDAASGVECQSETVYRQAERHRVPVVCFVNKIDKPGADLSLCVDDLRERLGARPVVLHVPIDGGRVLLDVVREVSLTFDDDRSYVVGPVPEAYLGAVAEARRKVVEACADVSDAVLAMFCEGRPVAAVDLERALREGTLESKLLVVVCGSALKNRGIPQLLDAVVSYLPSPADLPPATGQGPRGEESRPADDSRETPLAALAFKTTSDKSAGFLTFVRIYSGVLRAGQAVRVMPRDVRDRVARMYVLHADTREPIDEAHAGAIVAITGASTVRTGDTLCDMSHPVTLERIHAPEPVALVSIEAKTSADRERLSSAIGKMLVEDPSLRVSTSEDTGQLVLGGMGALHLEIVVARLSSHHGVAVTRGKPRVAYRETLAKAARAEYRHIRQSGGTGQYACVTLSVAPSERGSGITFVDATVGGAVPKELVAAVEKGVRGAASRGVFAGYPVVDAEVRLVDGATHVKDSTPAAFEIAASLAFKRAALEAGHVLLEPLAHAEIVVPEAVVGGVVGDLQSRRGTVRSIAPRGTSVVVTAEMPLSSTFDWVSRLRGITGGRGTAVVKADGYGVLPETEARVLLTPA